MPNWLSEWRCGELHPGPTHFPIVAGLLAETVASQSEEAGRRLISYMYNRPPVLASQNHLVPHSSNSGAHPSRLSLSEILPAKSLRWTAVIVSFPACAHFPLAISPVQCIR